MQQRPLSEVVTCERTCGVRGTQNPKRKPSLLESFRRFGRARCLVARRSNAERFNSVLVAGSQLVPLDMAWSPAQTSFLPWFPSPPPHTWHRGASPDAYKHLSVFVHLASLVGRETYMNARLNKSIDGEQVETCMCTASFLASEPIVRSKRVPSNISHDQIN